MAESKAGAVEGLVKERDELFLRLQEPIKDLQSLGRTNTAQINFQLEEQAKVEQALADLRSNHRSLVDRLEQQGDAMQAMPGRMTKSMGEFRGQVDRSVAELRGQVNQSLQNVLIEIQS